MKNCVTAPSQFPVIYAVPRHYYTYVSRFKKFATLFLLILTLCAGTGVLLAFHAHLL